jgi:hypothetical protein
MRRGPASGRFIPKATADAVPLFARPIKSAPHVRGWGTRKANQRKDRSAWVARHIEQIKGSM